MIDKSKKFQKAGTWLPKGLPDRGPTEVAATRQMLETIRQVFERYGFEPVETPAMEYTDALGKFLPDQDRPNEGVFSFQDDDEQWISLRYDLTAPLARYVAENFDSLPKPYRSYRAGYVYRNEKPGPGRFRQFMQFDADTVGSASPAADAEMCMMAADTMEKLGIKRGSYLVKVNSRKVLDGVMDAIGLRGEENSRRRLTVFRAIDKLDKFKWEEIARLLGHGRKDESGDFTAGANLTPAQIDDIKRFLDFSVRIASTYFPDAARFLESAPDIAEKQYDQVRQGLSFLGQNSNVNEGVEELISIHKICCASGYVKRSHSKRREAIRVDPSVVRGLEYYTSAVYEVELTFSIEGEDGVPVRFGSVAGGGRYDGLVGRFRDDSVPATGFSIGVSRLMVALQHLKKIETKPEVGPVVVTIFDQDRIADYQKMVGALRKKKIRAELYLGSGKFGAQMKYADKRNSPCVIIQGSDEKARGEVLIKDCFQGELNKAITDRDEYKAAQARVQFSCREDDLVAKVREVLARHGVKWG
jgi:histidyl-tRNA synthetase